MVEAVGLIASDGETPSVTAEDGGATSLSEGGTRKRDHSSGRDGREIVAVFGGDCRTWRHGDVKLRRNSRRLRRRLSEDDTDYNIRQNEKPRQFDLKRGEGRGSVAESVPGVDAFVKRTAGVSP